MFTEEGFDADCTYTKDKAGAQERTVQKGWCVLGDGAVTIDFGADLDGKDFTYLDGNTGVESGTITYNDATKWTIPNTTKVFAILFEDGQYYPCEEQAGTFLSDVSGNGDHATLSADTVWNDEQWVASHSNIFGYNDKAWYDTNAWDWEVGSIALDNDMLLPRSFSGITGLVDINGVPLFDIGGVPLFAFDPTVITRDLINLGKYSHVI